MDRCGFGRSRRAEESFVIWRFLSVGWMAERSRHGTTEATLKRSRGLLVWPVFAAVEPYRVQHIEPLNWLVGAESLTGLGARLLA